MRKILERVQAAELALLVAILYLSWSLTSASAQTDAHAARPVTYSSTSQPLYDNWLRVPAYIPMRDGTRLAAEIYRPAMNDVAASDPLPVIWAYERYHRAARQDEPNSPRLKSTPWLQKVLKHGYVIVVVDVRGTGASFGTRRGELTPQVAQDAYDVTEWLAAQPWSNRRVGMFGRSYGGITQFLAAGARPPHLKAIFPEMAAFDIYDSIYAGGIFRQDFTANWSRLAQEADRNSRAQDAASIQPGALDHADISRQPKAELFSLLSQLPGRDSKEAGTGIAPYTDWNPSTWRGGVQQSGVAIYQLAGWYDLWPRDALFWLNNLNNPQKLIIGPWSHTQTGAVDMAAEHLRWYDHWLKDIDNGVTDEPPIRYYMLGAAQGEEWRSAWQWPLPEARQTRFFFHKGPSGSIDSVNDGRLSDKAPDESGEADSHGEREDVYIVDYSTTSGETSRWANGYGAKFSYANMAGNDAKGLTYTSGPLDADLAIAGHPVIELWISSSAADGDFFGYLEEVDALGYSHYITEGQLKASNRAMAEPPDNRLGLPFHSGYLKDRQKIPAGEPVALTFDLLPTAYLFHQGNRIRVTITCADKDNSLTEPQSPPPQVRIHRRLAASSCIMLPIIPTAQPEPSRPLPVALLAVFLLSVMAVAIFRFRQRPRAAQNNLDYHTP